MENNNDNGVTDLLDDVEHIANEGARLSRQAKRYYRTANHLFETAKYIGGSQFKEDSKIIKEMERVDSALFVSYRRKWIIIAVVTLIILIFL